MKQDRKIRICFEYLFRVKALVFLTKQTKNPLLFYLTKRFYKYQLFCKYANVLLSLSLFIVAYDDNPQL